MVKQPSQASVLGPTVCPECRLEFTTDAFVLVPLDLLEYEKELKEQSSQPTIVGATSCPGCNAALLDFAFVILSLRRYQGLREVLKRAEVKLADYTDPETNPRLSLAIRDEVIHVLEVIVCGRDSERIAEIEKLSRG
jgi:hypothetical protein